MKLCNITEKYIKWCDNDNPKLLGKKGAIKFYNDHNFKRLPRLTKLERTNMLEYVKGDPKKLNDLRYVLKKCFESLMYPNDIKKSDKRIMKKLSQGLIESKDIAPCHDGEACKEFNKYWKDGTIDDLAIKGGWHDKLKKVKNDKIWRNTAICTVLLQRKGKGECLTNKNGKIVGVPMSGAAYMNNSILAYVIEGMDGLARMPACRLPINKKQSCKCVKSRVLKKGKNKGKLFCDERSPKRCRLPSGWDKMVNKSGGGSKTVYVSGGGGAKSVKIKKPKKTVKKSCKCVKSRVLKKGKNKGKLFCDERSPKRCRLPSGWDKMANKSGGGAKAVSGGVKTAPDTKIMYYDRNASNIIELRDIAKKEFQTFLTKGGFSEIYTNPNNPNWIMRKSKIQRYHIKDEIKITKGMLNRPGEIPNLTDMWVETIPGDPRLWLYSINRRLTGNGNVFIKKKKYIKNKKLVSNFYNGLYNELKYLHNLGWACYDLKPGNILIDEVNINENTDNWVKLTDFGADWCKNKNQLNIVIDEEYQPLFMLLLFQLNTAGIIKLYNLGIKEKELEKGFIEFMHNLIKSSDHKLIRNLQYIYNFFLYLLIIPREYVENQFIKFPKKLQIPVQYFGNKFYPIQQTFLLYTCAADSQNFNTRGEKCYTIDLLSKYFSKINLLTKNQLDLHENIISIYENAVVSQAKKKKVNIYKSNKSNIYNKIIYKNFAEISDALLVS